MLALLSHAYRLFAPVHKAYQPIGENTFEVRPRPPGILPLPSREDVRCMPGGLRRSACVSYFCHTRT